MKIYAAGYDYDEEWVANYYGTTVENARLAVMRAWASANPGITAQWTPITEVSRHFSIADSAETYWQFSFQWDHETGGTGYEGWDIREFDVVEA